MATPISPLGTCCGQKSAQDRRGARCYHPSWKRGSWCHW
ncbi:hypothetical protein LEMLEM_LOCUS9195 [Lemmus lemmus]